jgi:hypothetical protein
MNVCGPRLLTTGAAICVAMLFLFKLTGSDAQDLPVNAQADVLKHQIAEAIKNNRDQDALAALDQYHQLEKRGVKIPPLVLFVEAQVAKRTGDPWRAYQAVTAFLKVAQPTGPHYQDAIAMYSALSADPTVKEAQRRREEAKKRAIAQAEAERVAELQRETEATARAQAQAAADAHAKAVDDNTRQLHELERQISSQIETCDNKWNHAGDVCVGLYERKGEKVYNACWSQATYNNDYERFMTACESHSSVCDAYRRYENLSKSELNAEDTETLWPSVFCKQ